MRHANKEHCVLAGVRSRIVNSASRMLLEHVVNVLHTCDVSFANTICSLIKPANGGSKCDAVITNLPGGFQFLKSRPKRVLIDLFHPDVVQLQKIYPISL